MQSLVILVNGNEAESLNESAKKIQQTRPVQAISDQTPLLTWKNQVDYTAVSDANSDHER
jgi:hypothetical protein